MTDLPNINLDGLEDCIVGHEYDEQTIIYSYDKILSKFIQDGMTGSEAVEYIDYNIVGLKPNGKFILLYED
jgi:hypothetical protein